MTEDEANYFALRAERLRCLVAAIGEEPTMEPMDNDLLPGGYRELLGDLDYDGADADLDLAAQCTDLARQLRAEAWRWFEFATWLLSCPRVERPISPAGAKGSAGQAAAQTLDLSKYLRELDFLLGRNYPSEPVVPVSEECARYAETVEPED